ncbi:MAG TPA: antibiotic biosynthesis monooxygenase [Bacteroidota bacterium]|nr:antibiotic biosynthesis monooxygenase [Bacteroidota bacterium]
MYMRLVQMNVDPEHSAPVQEYYDKTVIPALRTVPGCLFASLVMKEGRTGECLSLTLWNSIEEAERYSNSDVFAKFREQLRPMLSQATEWKMQLSKDLTLEYVPVEEEPVIKSYAVDSEPENVSTKGTFSKQLYIRIVAPKIRPGMAEEYKRIYLKTVLPALKQVKGCLYAYLTEGTGNPDEILSVTIWDGQASAEEYESTGQFHTLMSLVSSTFTDLYQWKMGLERNESKRVATTDDAAVGHYQVISAESFSRR